MQDEVLDVCGVAHRAKTYAGLSRLRGDAVGEVPGLGSIQY